MKTFHPHQEKNVFTHNSWTLSDEFIEIMKSNAFYLEHVRWDISRFRPSDIVANQLNSKEQAESTSTQTSSPLECDRRIDDDDVQETSQQQSCTAIDTVESRCPMSLRSKRKASEIETINEHPANTQTTRSKRH